MYKILCGRESDELSAFVEVAVEGTMVPAPKGFNGARFFAHQAIGWDEKTLTYEPKEKAYSVTEFRTGLRVTLKEHPSVASASRAANKRLREAGRAKFDQVLLKKLRKLKREVN